MKNLTLLEVFESPEKLDWREALYLPADKTLWRSSCEAILEDPDAFEYYDSSDNPVTISELGYRYILLCDDIVSIMENLKEKNKNPDFSSAFQAFEFYLKNDEFINN